MTLTEANELSVILKNDPRFPEHLSFDRLRREGIEHISALSGKIWTDHNLHDPGITILEMLCYAMLDLGYRTQLPIEDILTIEPGSGRPEDNFFTPAQILSCNPTTILDYRKMLIDIEGVRNAWLEVVGDVALYVDCQAKEPALSCTSTPPDCDVPLNGLYRVYLELEDAVPFCLGGGTAAAREDIIKEVKARLCRHRNLCEDFIDVCVLCKDEISLTGNIDLHTSADPEKVQVAIWKAIQTFLSPAPTYYTLQELLEKGRTMEAIFAGRPYTNWESFGFVDTEELQAIQLHKEIHVSDLYHIILDVEGVRSVRNLTLKAMHADVSTDCGDWKYNLIEHYLPKFCPDTSCFSFYKGSAVFQIDAERAKGLFLQSLSSTRKVKQAADFLDRPVPQGQFRPDLGDYYSIQNEFPKVYGIGEGQLSAQAPVAREAQALQLKGYLLFLDQILAGYLAQLNHLRDLFSMSPEHERGPEARHTYFTQRVESVPQIERLIRFYGNEQSQKKVLAIPVEKSKIEQEIEQVRQDPLIEISCDPHPFGLRFRRDSAIDLLSRDLEQGDQRIRVDRDSCGYFFVISTPFEEVALLSADHYSTEGEAKRVAESVSFLGALPENYRTIDRPTHDVPFYTFEFINSPVDYLQYTQRILEDEKLYRHRRNAFLDHLLARFAENFSELSLALYETDQEILDAKANFLSSYPEHSRNRGRAFDYCDPDAPPALQISGLEQRINALVGFGGQGRRMLCNFEVTKEDPGWQMKLNTPGRFSGFASVNFYRSQAAAKAASGAFLTALQDTANYRNQDHPARSVYELYIQFQGGLIKYQRDFSSSEEREEERKALLNLFQMHPAPGNIFVSSHVFRLFLYDREGISRRKSIGEFKDAEEALADISGFTQNINDQDPLDPNPPPPQLRLADLPNSQTHFIDLDGLNQHLHIYPCGFSWMLQSGQGQTWLESIEVLETTEQAGQTFVALLSAAAGDLELQAIDEDDLYLIQAVRDETVLAASVFEKPEKRDKALQELQTYLQTETETGFFFSGFKNPFAWFLVDDDGWKIFQSARLFRKKPDAGKDWRGWHEQSLDSSLFSIREEKDGFYRIELKTPGGRLIGHSPVLDRNFQDPDALIRQIMQAFSQKKQLKYERPETGWAFQLPDPKEPDERLLLSYALYPSRREALLGLEDMLLYTGKKSAFALTGDELNLNYSFVVQDPTGEFLAYHPATYETKTEREQARKEAFQYLKKLVLPIQYQPKYCYQFLDEEGGVLLQSLATYNSQGEASAAFDALLPCLADPLSYDKTKQEGYSFAVNKAGQLLAGHPLFYDDKKDLNLAIDGLIQAVLLHEYQVQAQEVPRLWQFQYCAVLNDRPSPVLIGKGDYKSEKEAVAAYENMVAAFDRVELQEEKKQAKTELALYDPTEPEKIAFYPDTLEPGFEAGQIKHHLSRLIQYAYDYHVAIDQQAGFAALNVQAVNPNQGPDPKPPKDCYVYRVVDKGPPLAYLPCGCFQNPEDPAIDYLIDYLCLQAQTPGAYVFPDICLRGEVVINIDHQYHYQIQDRKTGQVYFISYQAYPNAAAAQQAFEEEYLDVITLASDPVNYPGIDAGAIPTPISLDPPISGHERRTEFPIVYMPDGKYDPNLFAKWAHHFAAYPIQKVEKTTKDPCGRKPEYEYCFQLINTHGGIPIAITNGVFTTETDAQEYIDKLWVHLQTDPDFTVIGDDTHGYRCQLILPNYNQALLSVQVFPTEAEVDCTFLEHLLLDKNNIHIQGDPSGYQVFVSCAGPQDWKSKSCYGSAETAWNAYYHFLQLLAHKSNYTLCFDEALCCYQIAIRETLLESVDGYLSNNGAWGQALAFAMDTFDTLEEACKALEDCLDQDYKISYQQEMPVGPPDCLCYYGLFVLEISQAQKSFDFISCLSFCDDTAKDQFWEDLKNLGHSAGRLCIAQDENCKYRLALMDGGCVSEPKNLPGAPVAVSTASLVTLVEAQATLDRFCDLFDADSNQFIFDLVHVPSTSIYFCQIKTNNGEIFFQSAQSYQEQSAAKESCDRIRKLLPDKNNFQIMEHGGQYQIQLFDPANSVDPVGSCKTIVCEDRLCRTGLGELTGVAGREDAFYPYFDPDLNCYGFLVVKEDFRLARHPYTYHTPEERDKSLDVVCNSCMNKTIVDWTWEVKEKLVDSKQVYCIVIKGDGHPLWEAYPCFQDAASAEAVAEDQFWKILAYSRDKLFYYQNGNQISLCQTINSGVAGAECPEGDILARSPGTLTGDQLVEKALAYPIVKQDNGFSFQVYCDDFSPPQIPVKDNLPCLPCSGPVLQNLNLSPAHGGIVWESVQTYETVEEAMCYFKLHCELQKEKDHILPVGDLDCRDYSFELTRPDAIVAQHPQCHGNRESLLKAMEKTRACLEGEGMHLVEHILLRPRSNDKPKCDPALQTNDCDCLLPIDPDCNCGLSLNSFEDGLEPDFDCNQTSMDCADYIPGADPYSFWATIILPCWPKRFRRTNFREFFQEIVLQEAPAHIALRFLYLNPAQMCKFESEYRGYLQFLSREKDKQCPEDLDMPRSFIQCFTNLKNCCPDPDPVPENDACKFKSNPKVMGSGKQLEAVRNVLSFKPEVAIISEIITAGMVEKRLQSYLETAQAITDGNVIRSKTYEKTIKYLSKDPDAEAFNKVADHILRYGIGSDKVKAGDPYYMLLQITLYSFLDRQVLKKSIDEKEQKLATKVIGKIGRKKGIDLPQLSISWRGEHLQTRVGESAVNGYLEGLR